MAVAKPIFDQFLQPRKSEIFNESSKNYSVGAYDLTIQQIDALLRFYPENENAQSARVLRVLAEARQQIESPNPDSQRQTSLLLASIETEAITSEFRAEFLTVRRLVNAVNPLPE